MSTATSSAQSMRQQLDDLDALLQRMLSLPINDGDGGSTQEPPASLRTPEPVTVRFTPAQQPAATPPPPAPRFSAPRMRLLADSSPVPPPAETEPIGYERAFALNLNPQQGSSVLGQRSPASAPARAANPAVWRTEAVGPMVQEAAPAPSSRAIVSIEPLPTTPASSDVAPAPSASAALRPPVPRRPRTPLALLPLALIDATFDTVVMLLGAPGEWLTSRAGKNLLGYTGLLMLGTCAACGVLDWFSWTW